MAEAALCDPIPLCVDLDGTLCRSDTLLASVMALLRTQPLTAFLLPFWLLRGRARFKESVARRTSLDPARLPYNEILVAYLRERKAHGQPLWLVTAADARIAHAVATHLGLFDGVLASDGACNLKGAEKLRALEERFPGGFDYAGNSAPDLSIWRQARRAVVVNAPVRILLRALTEASVVHVFP
jgi:hypothetical protein